MYTNYCISHSCHVNAQDYTQIFLSCQRILNVLIITVITITLLKPWRNCSVNSFSRAISFVRFLSAHRISASSSVISRRSLDICAFIATRRERIVAIWFVCSRSRSRQCRFHICSMLFTYIIQHKITIHTFIQSDMITASIIRHCACRKNETVAYVLQRLNWSVIISRIKWQYSVPKITDFALDLFELFNFFIYLSFYLFIFVWFYVAD